MKRRDLLDLNEAVQNPGKPLSFSVSSDLKDEEDLDLLEPVTGTLEAVSTGNLLLISADFKTRCVLECARCTHPLEKVFEFEMDEQFQVEGVPSCYGSDNYAEVVSEELFPIFDKNALIRDNWIRQGLLVNMPQQPLCEYGWDGPCPHALSAERKPPEQGHPAFGALEELMKDEDKKD
jgi:uncharacterized protein